MAIVKYTLDPNNPPKLTPQQKARLDAMTDEDIDYSDIPELTDGFFERAVRGPLPSRPPAKQQLTIRVDSDVLTWLRSMGRGYHSRINYILRAAMETSRAAAVASTSSGRVLKSARRTAPTKSSSTRARARGKK